MTNETNKIPKETKVILISVGFVFVIFFGYFVINSFHINPSLITETKKEKSAREYKEYVRERMIKQDAATDVKKWSHEETNKTKSTNSASISESTSNSSSVN